MSQTHSHHAATVTDNYQLEISRWTTGRNVLVFAALISASSPASPATSPNPARFFRSYLVAFAYTSLIGLGAFFFVMVQFLTGSAWSVTMRRIMENIMITLPVGAAAVHPDRLRPAITSIPGPIQHAGGRRRGAARPSPAS